LEGAAADTEVADFWRERADRSRRRWSFEV